MFKTKEAYRKAWDNAYVQDSEIPLNVDIELASVCNLACPFCFWGEADFNAEMKKPADDGKAKKRFMPKELAIKIIDEAQYIGVPALKMNWRGESTLHPDYTEILKRTTCGNGFHDVLVNTNANCKETAVNGLFLASKVMVSLDSVNPSTYQKMRVSGRLTVALETISKLVLMKHPNIWVRRVITKDNENENFSRDVKNLFGDNVRVSEHQCFDRNVDEHHQISDPLRFERTYCGYPSQRMMIASDGTVYPCCVDYDGTMSMGKYPEQSLLEIWNGEKFKKLRNELRNNIFNSNTCKNCTSWMAYKSKNRDLVQDREITLF